MFHSQPRFMVGRPTHQPNVFTIFTNLYPEIPASMGGWCSMMFPSSVMNVWLYLLVFPHHGWFIKYPLYIMCIYIVISTVLTKNYQTNPNQGNCEYDFGVAGGQRVFLDTFAISVFSTSNPWYPWLVGKLFPIIKHSNMDCITHLYIISYSWFFPFEPRDWCRIFMAANLWNMQILHKSRYPQQT
jgi:hypothetical protein